MKSFLWMARILPEQELRYRQLHAAPPAEVVQGLRDMHVRNYRIAQLGESLVATFDYVGTHWESDLARHNDQPAMRRWAALTEPCLAPMNESGQRWIEPTDVFRQPLS